MKKKKILVAMSGGVDSSVAALLLAEQGYDVVGVSMKLYEESKCCGTAGIKDARQVCRNIGIPFYSLNCKGIFKKSIIDYFCRAYAQGITPNPCVPCNSIMKFGYLLKKARELNIRQVATGHYAGVARAGGRWVLKKGRDRNKEQSYFLYRLSQAQLASAVFPLGNYTKTKVRSIARASGLKVHDKPGSQEICFVPDNDYKGFLVRNNYKGKPGPIVDAAGKVLGKHRGLGFYTIGQRSGLGISCGEPRYVVSMEQDNTLVVGRDRETYSRSLVAGELNWIMKPRDNFKVMAKIRYRHKPASAVITREGRKLRAVFARKQRSITPGQSVVFYSGDTVVCGGIIEGSYD